MITKAYGNVNQTLTNKWKYLNCLIVYDLCRKDN
jgi:hypothetical protein